jgi:hypothetical protein
MLSEYSVDVWFLYGSFSYGLESRVCAYASQALTLEVALEGTDSADDVASFLESLVENPRGLVRSEICIYGPTSEEPVRLYTDVSPTLTSVFGPSSGLGKSVVAEHEATPTSVRLRFTHVAALTPSDNDAWQVLLTSVWPRFLAGGSRAPRRTP